MKKRLLALALASAMALGLVACGSTPAPTPSTSNPPASSTPATSTPAPSAGPTEISVCIASEPDTIDPALNSAVDGATLTSHLFSGLAGWSQDASGNIIIVPDAAVELPAFVQNDDGTVTYTYSIVEGMTWSDGKPVTAQDFVFSWNRAASPELSADYTYMFDVIQGYAEMWETDADDNFVNPDAKLAVEAVDEHTLTVTLNNVVAYWDELLAFPAYFPVREDVVSNEAWATDPATYVCNGRYSLAAWDHNSLITLEKNPNHHDAGNVTMDTIKFYLSDDQNNMLANFENGSWQLIDDVPTNEIPNLKVNYPDEFIVAGQIGTYFAIWNVNENILPASSNLKGEDAEKAMAEIRGAIALLFDRNYIVEEITQAGQVPASSYVAMGMIDTDGQDFYKNAGHNDGFAGYYDVSPDALDGNYTQAIEVLKKYYTFDEASQKFTDFPTMTYIYNTSEGHKAIGEYLQAALAGVGINVNLENEEWNTFLNTRKNGDYTFARHAWLGDYNDPISFLDMWITVSGNNDAQFGKGAHKNLKMYNMDLTPYGIDLKVENGTWAETFDVLIGLVKTSSDKQLRFDLMHLAEDMLMETGALTPLYFYTDLYMLSSNVNGYYGTPLGFKFFQYCTIDE